MERKNSQNLFRSANASAASINSGDVSDGSELPSEDGLSQITVTLPDEQRKELTTRLIEPSVTLSEMQTP